MRDLIFKLFDRLFWLFDTGKCYNCGYKIDYRGYNTTVCQRCKKRNY